MAIEPPKSEEQLILELCNAILEWMEDITGVLCYQPDIPQAHKTEIADAMKKVRDLQQQVLQQINQRRN